LTIATQTRNWQQQPVGNPAPPTRGTRGAPSLFPLLDYLRERWGGASLSTDNLMHCRPIVGGTAMSSHCGAAFDWRYINPGPGRAVMLNEVLPFVINHSYELNVQQIHDYVGCRIWKGIRSGDVRQGWLTQARGSQMGQLWAQWLHIEAGTWGWNDDRAVSERLGLVTGPGCTEQPPITDLEHGQFGLWPFAEKRWLWEGAFGDDVKYLQSVIYHKGGGSIAIDGGFGVQTRTRVIDLQLHQNANVFGSNLTVDGRVGPEVWAIIDAAALR